MKKFSKDLNQILRGFYYLDKDVGYEWIKSSLKNIQISKNGCCCDKCSACNTFLGIKEIFATGYTTINLTQNIKKLEIYLERVKKDNQSSE